MANGAGGSRQQRRTAYLKSLVLGIKAGAALTCFEHRQGSWENRRAQASALEQRLVRVWCLALVGRGHQGRTRQWVTLPGYGNGAVQASALALRRLARPIKLLHVRSDNWSPSLAFSRAFDALPLAAAKKRPSFPVIRCQYSEGSRNALDLRSASVISQITTPGAIR